MSNFINEKVIEEMADKFSGFDFKEAMNDILSWQDELGGSDRDEAVFDALESVMDIIIDRSTF